jgi:lysophospholipase L1-like esterase
LYLGLCLWHGLVGRPIPAFPEQFLPAVYPDFTPQEKQVLAAETWLRPQVFEDYVLFKERPFHGKYVNVSSFAFREVRNQGPWPPDAGNLNVFAFGGSTMFGWSLPDWQTIPSCLQEEFSAHSKKRVCVYNFGACGYYSAQERILLERLLGKGLKPDIAIFLDGLNDLSLPNDNETPGFQEWVDTAFASSRRMTVSYLLWITPMARVARDVRVRLMGQTDSTVFATQEEISLMIERYRRSKVLAEAACHAFGISSVFVWQPVPCYEYSTALDPFFHEQTRRDYQNHSAGYARMDQTAKTGALGRNFLWCADLQREERECLYVDDSHYTAKFSRKIAAAITRMCLERGLMKSESE